MQTKTSTDLLIGKNSIVVFAKMVMAEPMLAVELLAQSQHTEKILELLQEYPGALEKIAMCDQTPKWLKQAASLELEATGYVILT